MNSKMFGKLSDTDKEREARGLNFVDIPEAKLGGFTRDEIPEDNNL
jgi:hypothetical protein